MNCILKCYIPAVLFCSISLQTGAQQLQMVDAIYLKSGVILKGEILERIPEQSVTMRTTDGNTLTISFRQIDKIGREPLEALPDSLQQNRAVSNRSSYAVFGGLAIPSGLFASTTEHSSGGAMIGFGVGMEYRYQLLPELIWLTSVNYTSNGMNEKLFTHDDPEYIVKEIGSYRIISPMSGLEFKAALSPDLSLRFAGQMGLLIGFSPKIISGYFSMVTLESATATSIEFGLTMSLFFDKHYNIAFRYLSGEPEYVITQRYADLTSTGTVKQPTAIIQVVFGYTF